MAQIKRSKTTKERVLSKRWRLADAKARFSEIVRLAQQRPQRITVYGEDAVVIVSAQRYDEDHPSKTGADLVRAFSHAALQDIEFDRTPVTGELRHIVL